jgi:Transcriptional regulatory protein, C terminal/GAF domain
VHPPPATAPAVVARPLQLAVPEAPVSEAHLRSLHTAVTELSRPLPLQRIVAVVAHAAVDALDPEAVVIAIHEDDGLHLRGVHVAGLPEQTRQRLCTQPTAAPHLVKEIERLLLGADTRPTTLAALPISQGGRTLGLLVVGRPYDRPLSSDDRTFLNVLTHVCALAMDRLRMYADCFRVRAALRRHLTDVKPAGPQLRVGDMEIDLEGQRVTIGSQIVPLTPCEMRLLVLLAEQPGRARSRREILQHLWHTEHVGDERACDVHISNLRRKIERDPSRPERLITQRGYGYALQPR